MSFLIIIDTLFVFMLLLIDLLFLVLCGDGNCDGSIGEDCVSCVADCPYQHCGNIYYHFFLFLSFIRFY